MDKNGELRNLWILNINSESGTAIAKCGTKHSPLSDIDIVAGFITASRQLSHEMVTTPEKSKYSFENIEGGGKRLYFPTTWGNEVSLNEKAPQEAIPVITSMLQVSGPKMSDYEYNDILRYLRLINDEIIFRFMLGELTKERVIDPIINIDIINNVLKEFSFNKKGRLIGPKSNKFDSLVDKTILKVLRNDAQIVDLILSRVPLKYTCIQEEYKKSVNEAANFIKEQIHEFIEAESKLNHFRNEKIYAKKNSFKALREEYNEFLDSQETYFEKKRVLNIAIEEWHSIVEDLHIELQTSLKSQELKKITKLQELIPKGNGLNEFLNKVKEELLKENLSKTLSELESNVEATYTELEFILSNKNYNDKNKRLLDLKNGYETIISLINEDALYNLSNKLGEFNLKFNDIYQKDIPSEIREIFKTLRKNLVVKVINSIYEEIFNSYRKFKHVIVYSGDIKEIIFNKTTDKLKDFMSRIQDYSFASILENIIKRINPDSLVKRYCIDLLENYLQNYVYDHFIKKSFIRDDKKLIIAFDSYSLKFCSELLNEAGLNKEIYKEIERMQFSQKFKETFIQILDSFVSSRDIVIQELQNSQELINSWQKRIENMISNLKFQDNNITISKFINFCASFTRLSGKDESKAMKKNYYIRETIFNNNEPTTQFKEELATIFSKKSELKKIIDELEKLGKKSNDIFSNKEYNTILNDSRTLLFKELEKDLKSIKDIAKNLSNLINTNEAKKINQLLNDVKNARELLKDNKKLESFEKELNDIIKFDVFNKFSDILESLDNEFLNLDGFSHIKGMIKTLASSDPLIKESNIEKKHESRELLMEALVETYAHFYEDYFGKFILPTNTKIELKKLENFIKPGKLFYKQYEKTVDEFQLFNGLKILKNLLEYTKDNTHKYKNFKIDYLVNYLADYSNEKNYSTSEEFIKSFDSPRSIGKFLDYLMNKFTDPNQIKTVKQKADKFCNDLAAYLARKIKVKPRMPLELNIFNDEMMNIIIKIYENVQQGEEKYYLDQKHPNKDHPSRKYNYKNITPKKLQKFLDNIDGMDSAFISEMNSLEKSISFESYTLPSVDNIIKRISEKLKESLMNEFEKYGFNELVFENVNRIRITDILNKTEYEIPNDLKIKLIQEGRYNKDTIKEIIKISTKISDLLKFQMNVAISEESAFKDFLNQKIDNVHGGYIELPINVPDALNTGNRNKIFGKYAIWSKQRDKILGFKLPYDTANKSNFGEAMRASVYQDIFNELKPTTDILNKYSREIHTGFKSVYKKLYEY